jgi:hypothetical protein
LSRSRFSGSCVCVETRLFPPEQKVALPRSRRFRGFSFLRNWFLRNSYALPTFQTVSFFFL